MRTEIYIGLLVLGFFTAGCQDWLNVQPKTSVQEEDIFSTEFGFKDVLTGFYIDMGSQDLYGKNLTYGFVDFLAKRYDNTVVASELYNYQGEYKNTKDAIWKKGYNIIANINNLLHFAEVNREVLKHEHYYEIIKGEALGLRAFLHFDLLRLFGPVYKENPDAKSICYRTQMNKYATPRLPASAVVDSVLHDLLQAKSLLEKHDNELFGADEYNENRDAFLVLRQLRMNIWAVRAMLARVYLYKGDDASKELAYNYAKAVIECGHFRLMESNTSNRILFPEHIFALHVYELGKFVELDLGMQASDRLYALQSTIDELYEKGSGYATDFRQNNYYFQTSEGKLSLRKFDQSGYVGKYDGAEIMPLIRLPEMYYIVAECTKDAEESAKMLNEVRHFRAIPENLDIQGGQAYDRLDSRPGYDMTKTMRVNELMKEYQKEFYGEGQLFWFYKRHFYRQFYHCPLAAGMQKENYVPQVPDDELVFGNSN